MEHRPLNRISALITAGAMALMLIGCKGSTGANGPAGVNGTNGSNGSSGTAGTIAPLVLDAAVMTSDQWAALSPKVTITSATVTATAGQPVVTFTVTDAAGDPIKNLDTFTKFNSATDLTPSYPNFGFSIAKLVPGAVATDGNVSPSTWVNYLVMTMPTVTKASAPQGPHSPDSNGVLAPTPNVPGGYTYTFYTDVTKVAGALAAATIPTGDNPNDLGNLTFDANATTRVAVDFFGSARNTGSNTATGAASATAPTAVALAHANCDTYDFIPATGAAPAATATSRQIVDVSSCNACHTNLSYHSGQRVNPSYCVMCHTDQLKFGTVPAVFGAASATTYTSIKGNIAGYSEYAFLTIIHQLHMGQNLQMTNHDAKVDAVAGANKNTGSVPVNNIMYPQSIANCATCHNTALATTPQAGNWQTVPSIEACGSCHDLVNFAAGINHNVAGAGQVADDTMCGTCHTASDIVTYHLPVQPPTAAGVAAIAVNPANLPPGAVSPAFVIQSVGVNATNNPVVVFQAQLAGKAVPFNTYVAPTGTTLAYTATTPTELLPNYIGSSTIEVAFGAPQDGIVAPNDFNKAGSIDIRNTWRGATAGNTLTGPVAGWYTATLGNVYVPTTATTVSASIGYASSLPSTTKVPGTGTVTVASYTDSTAFIQTNVPGYSFNATTYQGGLVVYVQDVTLGAVSTSTRTFVPRRTITEVSKCNSCHGNVGTFTGVNLATRPETAPALSIQGAGWHSGVRNDPQACVFCHFQNANSGGWMYNLKEMVHSLHASGKRNTPYTFQASNQYFNLTYPGIINDCEACHVPGSYDFQTAANVAQIPNMLWSTNATGTTAAPAGAVVLSSPSAYVAGLASEPTYTSPWVVDGTNYGSAYSYNATATSANASYNAGGAAANVSTPEASMGYVQAAPSTLVTSPITAACYACHDSSTDAAHMVTNGGVIAQPRSAVVTNTGGINTVAIKSNEQCLVCHGTGAVADIYAVHMNF